jgi:hypothetical protein
MGLAPIRLRERDHALRGGVGEPDGGKPHPYSSLRSSPASKDVEPIIGHCGKSSKNVPTEPVTTFY